MEASMMNEIAKYLLIFLSLTLVYSILIMFGGRKIFKKANQKETTIFYPILNLFTMLDITDTTIFLGVLFFVPFLNIIALSIMLCRLGNVFKTGTIFKIGLVIFPVIFYPALAYSDRVYKAKDQESLNSLIKVNMMSQEELNELNKANRLSPPKVQSKPIKKVSENDNISVDSIFKAKLDVAEEVAPYRAVRVDLLGMNKVPNVKANDFKKEEKPKEDKNIEFIDL